ncbi:Feruloyl esterase [Neonectria magnoliae]|uniref:Feruloyl esterase n=1 Tax=Neonectria magnoliae TaxID=2732573 RepID=A0ABR1I3L4_9HYPO
MSGWIVPLVQSQNQNSMPDTNAAIFACGVSAIAPEAAVEPCARVHHCSHTEKHISTVRFSSTTNILTLVLATAVSTAQRLGIPTFEFLYTVNATLGERWQIGDYGHGSRVIIPITGGLFPGPRMSATVNNFGADWGVTDTKGIFQTGHPDYEWLDRVVAAGVLQRLTSEEKGNNVLIDM